MFLRLSAVGSVVFALLSFATVAHGARVPIGEARCSLAESIGDNVAGVVWNGATQALLAVDAGERRATLIDDQCQAMTQWDLAAIGMSLPAGVAYDSETARYAFVDATQARVFATDTTGALEGTCDLVALGAGSPTGIAWDPNLAQYLVVDGLRNEATAIHLDVLDGGPCTLVSSGDLSEAGISRPVDVTYLEDLRLYAVADEATDLIVYLNASLERRDAWQTLEGLGAGDVTGLAYDDAIERFYLVDFISDELIRADVRGTSVLVCPTEFFGSVTDVSYIEQSDELLYIDNVLLQLNVLDATTCAVTRSIALEPLGLLGSLAVGYLPSTDEIVVSDISPPELVFIDNATGVVNDRCSLEAIGAIVATSVGALPALDALVVVNEPDVIVLDRDCGLQLVTPLLTRGTPANDTFFGIGALAHNPALQSFVLYERFSGQVHSVGLGGRQDLEFDLDGVRHGGTTGLVSAGRPGAFFLQDNTRDGIFRLEVPALAEPRGVSGSYRAQGRPFALSLFELGDGVLTGRLSLPIGVVEVSGRRTDTGTVLVSFAATGMGALALTGRVSADFERIDFPPPLGTLVRER